MTTLSHGFQRVKVVALAVTDLDRAQQFYAETLSLPPVHERGILLGYAIGQTILMLKDDWYGAPTIEPNPRITIACGHAPDTAAFLQSKGITIADPVETVEDGYQIGSFLDSEGNKLWFCSMIEK